MDADVAHVDVLRVVVRVRYVDKLHTYRVVSPRTTAPSLPVSGVVGVQPL